MRKAASIAFLFSLVAASLALVGTKRAPEPIAPDSATVLPWRAAGLSEEQAATHLLSRFTFGARPGDVEAVTRLGLDRWFERQLAADLPDSALNTRLAARPELAMSPVELAEAYPPRRAARAAEPEMASEEMSSMESGSPRGNRKDRAERGAGKGKGGKQRELLEVMTEQKILRAVESENQLAEVMVDFWFNHFNVSFTDRQVRPFLVSYELDALRPNALGHFQDLLEATARHPAMLGYLDNARSVAEPGAPTTFDRRMEERRGSGRRVPARAEKTEKTEKAGAAESRKGLNENYARELMELHTLGVEGGYTQKDVTEVARAFTGWSVMPIGDKRAKAEERLERLRPRGGMGFVRSGEFFFRADRHDAGEKTVLGVRLPAGRGLEDGEQVLTMLAAHSSTAHFLARKLAVRFVADEPPAPLVDRLATVYLSSKGDLREMLRALVRSPEFWAKEARAAKVKSPFELAASALRASGGKVRETEAVVRWIARMGAPLYVNQVPTGYPDRGPAWLSAGTLVTRVNFGLDLAAGKVAGVDLGERRPGLAELLSSPQFQRR